MSPRESEIATYFTSFHSGKEGTDGELASHSARISLWGGAPNSPERRLGLHWWHASHPIGRVPFSSSSLQPIPFVLKRLTDHWVLSYARYYDLPRPFTISSELAAKGWKQVRCQIWRHH